MANCQGRFELGVMGVLPTPEFAAAFNIMHKPLLPLWRKFVKRPLKLSTKQRQIAENRKVLNSFK